VEEEEEEEEEEAEGGAKERTSLVWLLTDDAALSVAEESVEAAVEAEADGGVMIIETVEGSDLISG
jgi:hypothetical protein